MYRAIDLSSRSRSKWNEIPRKLVQLGDFNLKIETLKASFFGLWLGIGLIYAKKLEAKNPMQVYLS
jgi:hypothetical protein